MGLELFHPGVARIKCADCLKRAYNMETGEPQTYASGPNKELKFYEGPSHKPPCQTGWKCPKGDPSQEADFVLSKKNQLTVLLWRHVRATHGQLLDGAVDRLLADNLSILDSIFTDRERILVSRDTADGMASTLLRILKR